MSPDIHQQDRSYQRGLVLGLTMAEIMVLIVFMLLLALAAALYRDQLILVDKQAHIDDLTRDVRSAREKIGALIPDAAKRAEFDDVFRDLQAAKATNQQLQQELDRLRPLEEKARQADRIAEALRKAGVDPDVMKDMKEVTDRLELANQVVDIAREMSGDGTKPDPQRIADMLSSSHQADQKIVNLQGQNKFLVDRLKAAGKGNELPSCWTTPEGKVEYIFDVLITDQGAILTDNAIPHRAEEQAQLPISMVKFGKDLSQQEIKQQTRALFDWSEHEKCRFYVRIRSQNRTMPRDVFGTVTDVFYYVLIRR